MFARVKTHTHAEVDLVKWLALIAIACALVIFWVSSARGVEVARPPGLLPPDTPAIPMPPALSVTRTR